MKSEQECLRTMTLLRQLMPSSPQEVHRWAKVPAPIIVILGKEASVNPNGQLTFFTVLNLLLRLHPIITEIYVIFERNSRLITPIPLVNNTSLTEAVTHFSSIISTGVNLRILPSLSCEPLVLIGIGKTGIRHPNMVSISSDGWFVHLVAKSDDREFSSNFNPIGAMATACWAVSEIFKRVLEYKGTTLGIKSSELPRMNLLEDEIHFSLFSYEQIKLNADNPTLPKTIDLGQVFTVGVGAGGGACLYCLVCLPELQGKVVLVDPDEVTLSNLNRYIYAIRKDAKEKVPKVHLIRKLFDQFPNLEIDAYKKTYLEFSKITKYDSFDLLISTVDNLETRQAIQWDLPRIIFDAGVAERGFYVKRVEMGLTACHVCLQNNNKQDPDRDLANFIGLPYEEVKTLRNNNGYFKDWHISQMQEVQCRLGFPLPSLGERFTDWVSLHCGQMSFEGQASLIVPIPFAAVLPGILIGGEILKERIFPDRALKGDVTYIDHDLFSRPNHWIKFSPLPQKNCSACKDSFILQKYRKKYYNSLMI